MDEELFFSPLTHRRSRAWDPRAKTLILFLYAPLTFLRPLPLQILDFLLLLGGLGATGLTPLRFLWKSRGFLILLLFFLVMHTIALASESSEATFLYRFIGEIPEALPKIIPLILVYSGGILFVRTTGHAEIRRSLTFLLLPLPGFWSERIGTALGLTFTMLPLLLGEFRKIREAQVSRGGDNLKNPVRRMALPLFPLLVNSLVKSRSLAEAMEARAWDSGIPKKGIRERQKAHYLYQKWTLRDSLFFFSMVLYLLLSLFLTWRP